MVVIADEEDEKLAKWKMGLHPVETRWIKGSGRVLITALCQTESEREGLIMKSGTLLLVAVNDR